MVKSEKETKISNELIIQALDVYLQEFIHRDKHLWSQNYKFFFSSLTVILLPNLTEHFGMVLPEKLTAYSWIFPAVGIILSFIFLYVSLGLTKRLRAISTTYNNLIKLLPKELQRRSINDMPVKFLNHSHTYVMSILMFLALIVIGIFSLI